MVGDALWYEAAMVVGITNALNVVADGLGPLMTPAKPGAEVAATCDEICAFYATGGDVPVPFGLAAHDPGYLADLWSAVKRAFGDNHLSRRLKTALAFAVSLTTRSAFGTAFHLGELRRLGVGEGGIMEVVGVTQMFSSYTKIADTLQLEPDMGGIAPVDDSPAPAGAPRAQ
jgi:alkylhydroperoxidase/carboxymuconolactone decarboxylase family protein YurZ